MFPVDPMKTWMYHINAKPFKSCGDTDNCKCQSYGSANKQVIKLSKLLEIHHLDTMNVL